MYCSTVDEAKECIEDSETIFPLLERAWIRMKRTDSLSEEVLEVRCLDAGASMWVTLRRSEADEVWERIVAWRSEREEWEELSWMQASVVVDGRRRRTSESTK
jgi:hypothetical protein